MLSFGHAANEMFSIDPEEAEALSRAWQWAVTTRPVESDEAGAASMRRGDEVVFDRLEPQPRNNQGEWPAAVRHWFNIVAHTDVTALSRPQLTARFGPGIEDLTIEPRAVTDSLSTYLLDRSTGLAVATGLSAELR